MNQVNPDSGSSIHTSLPALSQSETQYLEIFENLSDYVYLLEVTNDNRFRYLATNPAYEKLLHLKKGDLIGLYFGEYFEGFSKSATVEISLAAFAKCRELGEILEDEAYLQTPFEVRWFFSTLIPLKDHNGVVKRILTISRDTTERKKAEQEISFMSFTLDQLHEAVLLVDMENCLHFRYVNDRACQALGYCREELLQMCIGDITTTKQDTLVCPDEPICLEFFDHFESNLRHKDGHNFPVEISCSNLAYDNKLMRVCVVRDITERKNIEQERSSKLWFFKSMNLINKAIQSSDDLKIMLNAVLESVLDIFDCDRAFLIYPCDPSSESWRVPMECAKPEYPGAFALNLSRPIGDEIKPLLELLLNHDRPIQLGPDAELPLPDESTIIEFNIKSIMVMAVFPKQDKPWGFGIHQCSHPHLWSTDEEKLFQEIGRRLEDALTSLTSYQNIKENEEKYRTLAENIPDNVARYDLQCRRVYMNTRMIETLGKPLESLMSTIPIDAKYRAGLEKVIATGETVLIDHILQAQDGNSNFHQILMAAERNAMGKITGAIAIGRDLTQKWQMQISLAQREREFRTLAENSPDIIVRYDRACRRIYFNQVYKETFGLETVNALHTTPLDFWGLHSPDAQSYMELLEHIFQTHTKKNIDAELFNKDGQLRYLGMYLVPEVDYNNNVVSILCCSRDITLLKTAEQRRETAREEERKNIARELHDELGQRLTALNMDLFRLKMRFGADNPELIEQINNISSAVEANIQVLRNVVTLLRPAVLDMGLVTALKWLTNEFSNRNGIPCELRLPSQELKLEDNLATMIFRIVQESLTNIIRHAQASKASIWLDQNQNYFLLEISDDGVGFDPKSNHKPNSLGLKGIRERVQMLGGKLSIQSKPNCGVKLNILIYKSKLPKGSIVQQQFF
jgi:PAS domain S-box-containing protein